MVFISLFLVISLFALCGCSSALFNEKNKENALDNTESITTQISNVVYNGVELGWDALKNFADSYEVWINNTKVDTTQETSYAFVTEENSFNVRIEAVANDSSRISGECQFTCVGAFDMPTINNGIIAWGMLDGISEYWIKIDNELPVKVTGNTYELPGGNHEVSVKPVTKGLSFYAYSPKLIVDIISAPLMRFEKSTCSLYWNTTNDAVGYEIKIEKDGHSAIDIAPFGREATSYSDFGFNDAGEYIVKICAKGDSQNNKNDSKWYSLSIVRLKTPEINISQIKEVGNSYIISWYSVKNAEVYKINTPNGFDGATSDLTYSYPLEDNGVEENLVFSIYSESNAANILRCETPLTINAKRLRMVENLSVQDGYLNWNPVPNAQQYRINIDGKEFNVANNQYMLDVSAGTHIVKVKAVGNGKEVVSSRYSNIKTINKLSTPVNLSIDNSILSWDGVNGCTAYSVYMDNGNCLYNSTTSSILINRSDITVDTALYVVARGNGNSIMDSAPSKSKLICILGAPIVTMGRYGIQWTNLDNAVNYKIEIGDFVKYTSGNSYSFDEFSAGSYTVYVTALGNKSSFFDSEKSKAISVIKPETPQLDISAEMLRWSAIAGASNYEVKVDGQNARLLSGETTEYNPKFQTVGAHSLSVRAVGDGIKTVSSSWCEIAKNVQFLETPTGFNIYKTESGYKIVSEEVGNAIGYLFSIDGVIYESDTSQFLYKSSKAGGMTIKVAAKGDEFNYLNSTYCQEKTISVLAKPSSITFSKTTETTYMLSWDPVQFCQSYEVKIYKYTSFTSTEANAEVTRYLTATTLQIDVEGYEKIEVRVIALGDNKSTFDSEGTTATKIIR